MFTVFLLVLLLFDAIPAIKVGEPQNAQFRQDKISDGHLICFPNRENGLPWPIGNPRDIAGAIFHGSHCVDSALDYLANKNNRTAAYLHISHCRTVVKSALDYFIDHPNYTVPMEICEDLVELASDESCARQNGKVRCRRWGRPLLLLAVMWGTRPQLRNFPSGSGSAFFSDARLVYRDLTTDSRNLRELYTRISNENTDAIFTKHWEKRNITDAEQRFVHAWHSPAIYRLNAMGLYCREGEGRGAPLELLNKVLKAMPEEEYAEVE